MANKRDFLPITAEDMIKRGWDAPDFLYIVGEAYVDHPSFGHAIISRVLESLGFKVAILSLPDWHNINSFKIFGRPKYGILVSSGNLDSMVNHYTASKKVRSEDSYAPGGKRNMRPDRAVIVYANKAREAFPGVPVIIGGVEASLRRFAHYDYWDDKVRRSVLFDSGADLLIYGMGEKPIAEIAERLKNGENIKNITDIRGTVYLTDDIKSIAASSVFVPSFSEVCENKKSYAKAFMAESAEQDAVYGRAVIQKHENRYVVQNPPMPPLSTKELDRVYALPYMRTYHPSYEKDGGVPAIQEVEFSVAHNRGCFGGCNFCALTFHQGRVVTSRSHASILAEVGKIVNAEGFKGNIHDVGGPTANFRSASCSLQKERGICKNKQCLFPKPCKNLEVSHEDYLSLLRKIRAVPGVKRVFVRSGIRFDYLIYDKNEDFFKELVKYHVSGQLKVAPEHISPNVLSKMGKPSREVYEAFCEKFFKYSKEAGKNQFLVPYLMSSHPGSTLADAVELALYLKKTGYTPEQVQDFYPTPGTLSTTMFYTELDPRTMEKIYVPKTTEEKAMQRALLQYKNPKNRRLVLKALKLAGRNDLIGFSKDCLVRPETAKKPKEKTAPAKPYKSRKNKKR